MEKDREKAIDLYTQATELGNGLACWNLGIIFLNGDGVEQDIERGVRYMTEAARLGSEDAKKSLLELKQRHGIDTPETPKIQ